MNTKRTINGPTPAGGVRAELSFRDDDGNPVDESKATRLEITEYDSNGVDIMRTSMERMASSSDVKSSTQPAEAAEQQPQEKQAMNEKEPEKPKYPIIEELAPATEEEMAFWETEEAWPNPDDGYDILGFPIRDKPPES